MTNFVSFLSVTCFYVALCLPVDKTTPFDKIESVNSGMADLIQGDVRLPKKNTKPEGVANGIINETSYQWKDGIVPYMLDSDFTYEHRENIIKKAMRDIEAVTCIRFQEYTSPPSDVYLNIINGTGCWSYVGKVFYKPGQRQDLSLRIPGCHRDYIATHELLHALGAWHEQSRPDRDQYINLHYENMYNGTQSNFVVRKVNSLNSPYDPESVMHYSRKAFSKNGKATITWKADPSRELGGENLTPSDIYQINAYYRCSPVVTGPTTSTKKTTTTKPTTTRPTTTTTTTTSTTTKQTTTKTTTRLPTTTTTTTTRPTTTTTRTTTTKPITTTITSTTTPRTTSTSTMKTSTSTTVKPSEAACGDYFFYCNKAHFNQELCQFQHYKSYCPQTCKQCNGPDSEKCDNFKDYHPSWCSYRVARGYCISGNYNRREKTKTYCSKSCCMDGSLYSTKGLSF